jgi:hypothetical protein
MPSNFSNLTVVTVTGEPGAHGAAAAAPSLLHSAAQLPGSRALMISPERPRGLPAHVEHRRVKPFGYIGYGVFILYCLEMFIETDFALIVQKDGWVLNGENWREEFLEYDYIGAPSVSGVTVDAAGQRTLHNHYTWQDYVGRSDLRLLPVYNGGLSLRSRRLLTAPRRLGLTMNIAPPHVVHDDRHSPSLFEMHWPWAHNTEDTQICVYMREALERDGIRFAPLDLALDFSFEYIGEVIHADYDFGRAFGTHCKLRSFLGGHPPIIDCRESRVDIEGVHRQAEVNAFLKTKYGYDITF